MKNKSIVWVKIKSDKYYNLLLKLNKIGINVLEIKKDKNNILIKTYYEDYKRIKKYLISYKVKIVSKTGLIKYIEVAKKYIVFIISIIISIVLLFIINNMIFKVEIKTDNKKVEKLLIKELKSYGLSTLKLKKRHDKIEVIVKEILDNHKNEIEWLEIKFDGLIMIVNVTEKISKKEEDNYENCNIVATKDGKILSLNLYRGVALKEINDYVLKGDILISGSITHNEEVKDIVCASGEVYGEVWYKVKVEVPFEETITKYTGKNRYNLSIKVNDNIYSIFRSRVNDKEEDVTNLYKLNDFEINLVKEKEIIKDKNILSEEEAYNKALKLAEEKILLMLQKEEEILVKKVLKNTTNNSTIYLELFIVTKENIGELQVVKEGL